MRRLHDWVLSLGAVVCFATGLVAIEAFLRVADPDYLNRLHGDESSNVYSETYGWELRKGFRVPTSASGRLSTVGDIGDPSMPTASLPVARAS
jgi:hypothetical protein